MKSATATPPKLQPGDLVMVTSSIMGNAGRLARVIGPSGDLDLVSLALGGCWTVAALGDWPFERLDRAPACVGRAYGVQLCNFNAEPIPATVRKPLLGGCA